MTAFLDKYIPRIFGAAYVAGTVFMAGSLVHCTVEVTRKLKEETQIEMERNNGREMEYTDKLLKRYDTNSDGSLQLDELRRLVFDGRWVKPE